MADEIADIKFHEATTDGGVTVTTRAGVQSGYGALSTAMSSPAGANLCANLNGSSPAQVIAALIQFARETAGLEP